ncbi:hypothetical protein BLOT_006483 [Blomia tropicalis]|nr:hypothetical protein BLOT_006483 [Blomia tropicalis]
MRFFFDCQLLVAILGLKRSPLSKYANDKDDYDHLDNDAIPSSSMSVSGAFHQMVYRDGFMSICSNRSKLYPVLRLEFISTRHLVLEDNLQLAAYGFLFNCEFVIIEPSICQDTVQSKGNS